MTIAPTATCSRVAARTASGPSAMRPTSMPWPPVIVMPRAAAMMRGPSSEPRSIWRASSMTIDPFAPRSRTVVTPLRRVRRALRNAFSAAAASLSRVSASKFALPSSVRWLWQLMSPGSAKPLGACTVRDFSPFGVLCARDRLPTQAISPSSMTTAASDVALVPSKRPSISRIVRIARQYRPQMPHPLLERLRARGFVLPDYEGGGLLNVPATVLDVLGARDAGDASTLKALDPALREGVKQVVVVLADGLGWWQLEMLCDQGVTPFLAELRGRARRRDGGQPIEAATGFPASSAAGNH